MKKIAVLFLLMLTASFSFSQDNYNINTRNSDRSNILASKIKSKSIWEYHYSKTNNDVLADSGYKSYYYGYDEQGRITEFTKYHVFSDLTKREIYQYGKNDNISVCTRYNAKNDRIEVITYKYNKSGRLKKEIHEAYYNSVRVGVYFTILASVMESELFGRVQDELVIEPRLESYSIIINITDPDEQNQYIVIGDESDPTSPRYSWGQLSMDTQRDLLAYQGPNRKEHEYVTKFISNVIFKYDKAGNMTGREVYNTSNDLIEKESFTYDASGRRISYTKYNSSGKPISLERYTYDAAGRMTESAGMEPGGSLTGRLNYSYDEDGNVTGKTWINAFGEINSRYRYIYEDDRLKEEIKYRGETEKEGSIRYFYNDKGDPGESVKYDINDHKDKLLKYVYEYY